MRWRRPPIWITPRITGTTLLIAIIYMLVNLIVDILYTVIDPRIRES